MQRMVVNGKYVGNLIGSTLVKRGRQVVRMYSMDGYGVSQHLCLHPRIKHIRLEVDGRVYKASTGRFIEKGIPYHKQGYEPQWILPRHMFEVVDARQTSLC